MPRVIDQNILDDKQFTINVVLTATMIKTANKKGGFSFNFEPIRSLFTSLLPFFANYRPKHPFIQGFTYYKNRQEYQHTCNGTAQPGFRYSWKLHPAELRT